MKKTATLLLTLLLCTSLLVGCATKEQESTNSPDGSNAKHLNISFNSAIETIDPAEESWNATRIGVGERLFRLDNDMNVQPWLAESYENVDELTWKINLRDDVNFSNGKKMTGDAVKACLDRTIANSQRAITMLDIASIEADGNVLTVTTNSVNAALPANMCDLVATILDVEEIEENGIYVAGTGPFVVDELVKDEKIELVANEDYWGEKPKLNTVSGIFYTDGNAAAMALESGDLDMCFQLPSENMFHFEGLDGFTVHKQLGSRSQIMIINFENDLLADLVVRKAITMSIDREGFAANINKGNSSAATAIFPTSYSYGKVPGVVYDVEGAKDLLAEAGYFDTNGNGILDKDGKELSFRLYTYGAHGALLPTYGEAIKDALSEVGIEINLELMDFSQQDALLAAGDFDITLNSYIMAPIGDPQYFTNIMLRTGADYNYGHYSNPEVDRLAEELKTSFEKADRERIAMEIQEQIVSDCSFITLGHLRYTVVTSNAVSGVNAHSTEYYLLDSNLDINK